MIGNIHTKVIKTCLDYNIIHMDNNDKNLNSKVDVVKVKD